jgi:ribonuclease J
VKDAAKWEEDLFKRYSERGKVVQPEDIKHNEDQYVLCLSFWDINELVDIRPSAGGIYIYSSSEAFTEEQRFDIKRLRQWLIHFGMTPVGLPLVETGKAPENESGFHASGHASGADLLHVIETIQPRIVIPVHTTNPELFTKLLSGRVKVVVPRKQEVIPIE